MERLTGGSGRAALFVLLACIPCCLPLLALAGGALTAAAGAFVASGSTWLAGAVLAVGTVGAAAVLRRRRRRRPAGRLPQPLPLLDQWSPSRRETGA